METNSIVVEAIYQAPLAKVWQALTDQEQMRHWYFPLDDFKAEPGFEFHFSGGSEAKKYIHHCVVQEAVEARLLSYTWKYEGYPGDTLVIFELFPDGEQTALRLSHFGLATFPQDNPDFRRESFEAGWKEIIGQQLKAYVERE